MVVRWLSKLLSRSTRRPVRVPRPLHDRSFRPGCEALETREMLAASVLSSALGQSAVFSVDATGALSRDNGTGAVLIATNVQGIVDGFDAAGNKALDVLYRNGHLSAWNTASQSLLGTLPNLGLQDLKQVFYGVDYQGNNAIQVVLNDGSAGEFNVSGWLLTDSSGVQSLVSGTDRQGNPATLLFVMDGSVYARDGAVGSALLGFVRQQFNGVDAHGNMATQVVLNDGSAGEISNGAWSWTDSSGISSLASGLDRQGNAATMVFVSNGDVYARSGAGSILLGNAPGLEGHVKQWFFGVDAHGTHAVQVVLDDGSAGEFSGGAWSWTDSGGIVGLMNGLDEAGRPATIGFTMGGLVLERNGYVGASWLAQAPGLADRFINHVHQWFYARDAQGNDAVHVILDDGTHGVFYAGQWAEIRSYPLAGSLALASVLDLNPLILNFAQQHLGQFVDAGMHPSGQLNKNQCWDLAGKAILNTGQQILPSMQDPPGKVNADYVWGSLVFKQSAWKTGDIVEQESDLVSTAHPIRPGDIMQFRDYVDSNGVSAPHHTAIFEAYLGNGKYKVLQQNAPEFSPVTEAIYDLSSMTQGTVWFYEVQAVGK